MEKQINFKTTHKACSNIAFIKYWGKFGRQLPMNPSLSMLIPHCESTMELTYSNKENLGLRSFSFNEKENQEFKDRIQKYFNDISEQLPVLKVGTLDIKSTNNFPHSTGIASSASAFAALAKCLVDLESKLGVNSKNPRNRASHIARLGSGSACRSVNNSDLASWGENFIESSSNEYSQAINLSDSTKTKLGWPLLDTVLVVSKTKKEVSSSQGHILMNSHPFKDSRVAQAKENFRVMYQAILNGDIETFGEILENEAMSLHAMMMCSYPSFCLLHPGTLIIIEKIKNFRKQYKIPVYFTLDAGPNVHCIYPAKFKIEVNHFIKENLLNDCLDVLWEENEQ